MTDNAAAETRVLPLEGGRNFRDLGGYRAGDGRRVRWGRLFRSGSLARLTARDYAHLNHLGVEVVCDFRSSQERAAEPTAWQGRAPRFIWRHYELELGRLVETFNRSPTAASVREAMVGSYGRTAYTHADLYRQLFEVLEETEAPVIFHCAAGKDRTGVFAALLLTALGVSRADIVEDYSLTDKIINLERDTVVDHISAGYGVLAQLTPEVRAPLFASDPEYISAAFALIEREEGSIDNYLEGRLGMTAARVASLRDRLLEVA
jgi:protein-tyrosine phosphatase